MEYTEANELLKKALSDLKYIWSLYGEGLEVLNWHYNGDTEDLDNFLDNLLDGELVNQIAEYLLIEGLLDD